MEQELTYQKAAKKYPVQVKECIAKLRSSRSKYKNKKPDKCLWVMYFCKKVGLRDGSSEYPARLQVMPTPNAGRYSSDTKFDKTPSEVEDYIKSLDTMNSSEESLSPEEVLKELSKDPGFVVVRKEGQRMKGKASIHMIKPIHELVKFSPFIRLSKRPKFHVNFEHNYCSKKAAIDAILKVANKLDIELTEIKTIDST